MMMIMCGGAFRAPVGGYNFCHVGDLWAFGLLRGDQWLPLHTHNVFFYCCSFRERQVFTKGGFFVLCYFLCCCKLFCYPLAKGQFAFLFVLFSRTSGVHQRGAPLGTKGEGNAKLVQNLTFPSPFFPVGSPLWTLPSLNPFFH